MGERQERSPSVLAVGAAALLSDCGDGIAASWSPECLHSF